MKKTLLKVLLPALAVSLLFAALLLAPQLKTTALFAPTADAAGAVIASGNCGASGDNVKFRLYDDGQLEIYGSGAMKDYIGNAVSPFKDLTFDWINVKDGVTSIGAYAFDQCAGLQAANLPSTLVTVGDSAFQRTGLTFITLPEGVTSVEDYAFFKCNALKDVTLPSTLQTCSGFYGCEHIQRVHIASISSFLKTSFRARNSYGPDYNPLSCGAALILNGDEVTSVTIPEDVTELKLSAFSGCSSLQTVTIPNHVTEIGAYAFYNCDSLQSIRIPNSVTSLGNYAFYKCGSLKTVYIGSGLTEINTSTFSYCYQLNTVSLGGNVTAIGPYAFSHCTSLKSISLIEGLSSIGEGAFYECSALRTIHLPSTVTTVGSNAFENCSSLFAVWFKNPQLRLTNYAFGSCNALKTVLFSGTLDEWNSFAEADGVNWQLKESTHITKTEKVYSLVSGNLVWCAVANGGKTLCVYGKGAIPNAQSAGNVTWSAYVNSITDLVISEGITAIGKYNFADHPKLKTVRMTDTVTTVGESAFRNCSNLETVNFDGSCDQWAAVTVESGNAYLGEANVTFGKYAVRFDANGGDNAPEPFHVKKGEGRDLPRTAPTHDDFVNFAGWSESPDGSDPIAKTAYYTPTHDVTLYAVWEAPGTIVPSRETEYFLLKSERKYIKFTAPVFGAYTLTSAGNYDACAELFNAQKEYLVMQDGGGEGENFKLVSNLAKGQTYYYKIYAHGEDFNGGTVRLTLTPLLGDVADLSAKACADKALKLSWTTVSCATQYNVFRYKSTENGYVYVGTSYDKDYTAKDLNPGTTYYFKVMPVYKSGGATVLGNMSNVASATAINAPAVPTGVTAKASGDKAITVSWKAVTGATQYNVFRYNGTTKTYVYKGTTFATDEKPTSYVDAGLAAGTTYYYRVVSVIKNNNGTVVSEMSDYAKAKAINAPAVPTGVTAKASADKQITITWNAAATATQYNIYRYNDATKTYVYRGTTFSTDAAPTTYIEKGLTAGTTYYYRVVSVIKNDNGTVVSAKSDYAKAKAINAPAVPTGVTAKASGDKAITVSWTKVTGATQYNVYRYNGATKSYAYKGTTFATDANPTSYADAGLTTGTTYYYRVVSVIKNDNGTVVSAKSDYAKAKAINAPAVPTGVTAKASADKQITITWNAAATATQYNIYRYNDATKTYVYRGTTFSTDAAPTTYIEKGLTAGTTYYYRVVSVIKNDNGTVVSAKSDYAKAKAINAPAVPTGVKATASGSKTIKVTWTKVTGATQYNIYRFNSAKGEYTYKGTVKATDPAAYIDTGLTAGTTYNYKVISVIKNDNGTVVSAMSAAATATAK